MGIVKTFLRDHGFIHVSDLKKPRPSGARAYAAAQLGRLTNDWLMTAASIDADIRAGLIPTRARARDLSQNNSHAKSYLRIMKKNIVGADGFRLQVKSKVMQNGKPLLDKQANDILEGAFREWSKPQYATMTGKFSFRKVQELVVEAMGRDGEIFIRLVRGQKINSFGFSLELIEPDWVDHKYNERLPTGNLVRMGVELNAWKRPVAYHVTTHDPQRELYGMLDVSGSRTRVPASDIIHIFDPERAGQTRGMPWMSAAMMSLHNLKGYSDAAIINARIGASKMGFLSDPEGTEGSYGQDLETDVDGNLVAEVNPGSIEDIGQRTFTSFDPKYPDGQYDPFTRSVLREISAGLGLAYSSLSNDSREATWSSLRSELAEERESWKMIQSWLIETFLDRVYAEWLSMVLLQDWSPLPVAKFRKFNAPKWVGRRWYWVDPLKEVNANQAAIESGFKSATQVVMEEGRDIEEVYAEIRDERELAKEYGLQFSYGGKSNGAGTSQADDGEGSSQEDGDQGDPEVSGRQGLGAGPEEGLLSGPGNGGWQ